MDEQRTQRMMRGQQYAHDGGSDLQQLYPDRVRRVGDAVGVGMEWNEDAVGRFAA